LSLEPKEKAPGLITTSTGNHGLGFATALSVSGDRGEIYLPVHAVDSKVAALASFMNHTERFQGKKVAIVICGANIPTEKLKSLCERIATRESQRMTSYFSKIVL